VCLRDAGDTCYHPHFSFVLPLWCSSRDLVDWSRTSSTCTTTCNAPTPFFLQPRNAPNALLTSTGLARAHAVNVQCLQFNHGDQFATTTPIPDRIYSFGSGGNALRLKEVDQVGNSVVLVQSVNFAQRRSTVVGEHKNGGPSSHFSIFGKEKAKKSTSYPVINVTSDNSRI